MPGKRWPSGGVQGGVPQDPRDMAKAGLLEAQFPEVKVRTRRNDACYRRRVMPGHEPVGPGTLRDSGASPSEGGQGDEWAAYVVLDTYNDVVPRDRLRGASPMATECP
jgi:hypothetical protein